jgi:hypothetical protein
MQHLTLDCHFSTTVREQIFAWNGTFGVPPPPGGRSLNDWWDETISHLPKEKKREASGAIIYSMWGVWKERNRRVFQNTALQPTAVAALVKEDIAPEGVCAHPGSRGREFCLVLFVSFLVLCFSVRMRIFCN